MKKCPSCNGFGFIVPLFNPIKIDCEACAGAGELDMELAWLGYGEEMRKWRLDKGLTLREASRRYELDPSNLSKMERGLIKPRCYYEVH